MPANKQQQQPDDLGFVPLQAQGDDDLGFVPSEQQPPAEPAGPISRFISGAVEPTVDMWKTALTNPGNLGSDTSVKHDPYGEKFDLDDAIHSLSLGNVVRNTWDELKSLNPIATDKFKTGDVAGGIGKSVGNLAYMARGRKAAENATVARLPERLINISFNATPAAKLLGREVTGMVPLLKRFEKFRKPTFEEWGQAGKSFFDRRPSAPEIPSKPFEYVDPWMPRKGAEPQPQPSRSSAERFADTRDDLGIMEAMRADMSAQERAGLATESRQFADRNSMDSPKWLRNQEAKNDLAMQEAERKAKAPVKYTKTVTPKAKKARLSVVDEIQSPDDLSDLLTKSIKRARATKGAR